MIENMIIPNDKKPAFGAPSLWLQEFHKLTSCDPKKTVIQVG